MIEERTRPEQPGIVLVDPGLRRFRTPFTPSLAVGYLAAALERAGFDVGVVDWEAAGERGRRRLLENPPRLLGITATSFTFEQALGIARRVRAGSPATRTVLGGAHVAVAGEETLAHDGLDYAIRGEGEASLALLAAALLERQGGDGSPPAAALASIPGLVFRDATGAVRSIPPAPWNEDLDRLPFPAFRLFPAAGFPAMRGYECYPMLTSRGCPFGCVFCSAHLVSGRRWRARSPANVLAEIEHALAAFPIPYRWFGFLDDTLNLKPERVEEICDGLLSKDLRVVWSSGGFRADLAPPGLCAKMKRAGCASVAIGIESADPETLKRIGKGEKIEQVEQGIRDLAAAGIEVIGQFMIGNPGETYEKASRSIDFARRMPLSILEFSLARPYPGTALWEYATREGRFLASDVTPAHHFASQPLFETPEFSAPERLRAYREAQRLRFRRNSRTAVVRKLKLAKRIIAQRLGKLLVHARSC